MTERRLLEPQARPLEITVTDDGAIIRVDFGKLVTWVGFDRESALSFGRLLVERALRLPMKQ